MKLLVIDMDGTCLNSKNKIFEKTMQALKDAADAGITVVPTTGRAMSCLPHQLRENPFYRYVIISNGAEVWDLIEQKSIFSAYIPDERGLAVLKDAEEARLGITAHIAHDSFVQGQVLYAIGKALYGVDSAEAIKVKRVSDCLAQHPCGLEEIQLFFFTEGMRKRTVELASKYTDLAVSYGSRYVEIYSRDATKGNAVSALAKHLNIAREDIVCVGDGDNDIPMFEVSGLRLAMGNATNGLKMIADHTLPTNDEEGVAEAIYRYLLR